MYIYIYNIHLYILYTYIYKPTLIYTFDRYIYFLTLYNLGH